MYVFKKTPGVSKRTWSTSREPLLLWHCISSVRSRQGSWSQKTQQLHPFLDQDNYNPNFVEKKKHQTKTTQELRTPGFKRVVLPSSETPKPKQPKTEKRVDARFQWSNHEIQTSAVGSIFQSLLKSHLAVNSISQKSCGFNRLKYPLVI